MTGDICHGGGCLAPASPSMLVARHQRRSKVVTAKRRVALRPGASGSSAPSTETHDELPSSGLVESLPAHDRIVRGRGGGCTCSSPMVSREDPSDRGHAMTQSARTTDVDRRVRGRRVRHGPRWRCPRQAPRAAPPAEGAVPRRRRGDGAERRGCSAHDGSPPGAVSARARTAAPSRPTGPSPAGARTTTGRPHHPTAPSPPSAPEACTAPRSGPTGRWLAGATTPSSRPHHPPPRSPPSLPVSSTTAGCARTGRWSAGAATSSGSSRRPPARSPT